jgi:formylmethanofuran dehydrogenase subunit E
MDMETVVDVKAEVWSYCTKCGERTVQKKVDNKKLLCQCGTVNKDGVPWNERKYTN